MPLREVGLPLGIKEPRGGSGLVTPCKRSAAWGGTVPNSIRPRGGRTRSIVASSATSTRPMPLCACCPRPRSCYPTTAHGAGFGGASHPINRIPLFLAGTDDCKNILVAKV